MGQDSNNQYAAPHVWNLVAKILREHYQDATASIDDQATILLIQQSFADRFSQDEGFDRDDFLRKCGFE